MEYAIEAQGLTRIYQNKVALYNFSLKVERGKIFGLLGPNGAGKSTLIRIIAGLEKPDDGTLKIFGSAADVKNRKRIGIAPQENAIYPLLTCMENLLYFGSLYGVGGKKARTRAVYLLENLGLGPKKDTPSEFLSGGMKRRLSLACALMHKPDIIILDEPTTGLDPATRISMWATLKQVLSESKATLILTTHYMEEAEALCEKIAFMNSGVIVAEGTLDELKKLVGKEIAKLKSVPGEPKHLVEIIKGTKGVDNVTATEHGVIMEGKDLGAEMAGISRALKDNGETVVELSISKPSLEDVFLKLTGTKLREAGKIEPDK